MQEFEEKWHTLWPQEQHFWITISQLQALPAHEIQPGIVNSDFWLTRLRAPDLCMEETNKLILFNDIPHVNPNHTDGTFVREIDKVAEMCRKDED